MKGLIIKDLYVIRKYSRIVWAFIAFYFVFSFMSKDSSFLSGMIILVCSMMAVTSFSYDDLAKWNLYALALPVTRKQVVMSKYILGVVLALSGALAAGILSLVNAGVMHTDLGDKLMTVYVLFCIGILFICIMLPLIYKFGTEKSRFMMIICFAVPTAAFAFLGQAGVSLNADALMKSLVIASPAALIILLVVSYNLSCMVFNKKDL